MLRLATLVMVLAAFGCRIGATDATTASADPDAGTAADPPDARSVPANGDARPPSCGEAQASANTDGYPCAAGKTLFVTDLGSVCATPCRSSSDCADGLACVAKAIASERGGLITNFVGYCGPASASRPR